MSVDEESNAFGMGQGCSVHGDDHMKECSMCGAEFCRICLPRTAVCPDCAEQSEDDDEEKDSSEFDDITRVGTVVEDEEKEEKEDESTEDVVEEDREKD